MASVIVAGDVHLGAHNADVTAFTAFLEDVYRQQDAIAELVLLGDLWDMVRRDPFGVAWETSDTLTQLKRVASELPVRYILGNHDIYLQNLEQSRYEFDLREEYTLQQNGTRIHFRHGHEFDGLHSNRLSSYLSGAGDRGDIDITRGRKDPVVASVREALSRFKGHVQSNGNGASVYPRRERRAHEFLETISADKLVYGHTHAPYVHHDNIAANPGSWKSTTPVHNTYLEISDGALSLYQYQSSGTNTCIDKAGSETSSTVLG